MVKPVVYLVFMIFYLFFQQNKFTKRQVFHRLGGAVN